MLLDPAQTFFNPPISIRDLVGTAAAIAGLVVYMSKKVQQGDSDSKQLASMAASQKAISETQAKMATDLAVQQNMIEEARDRERHRDRRIERLEEGVARAHPGFRPHRRATAEATE